MFAGISRAPRARQITVGSQVDNRRVADFATRLDVEHLCVSHHVAHDRTKTANSGGFRALGGATRSSGRRVLAAQAMAELRSVIR